jgi:hypothetical protein
MATTIDVIRDRIASLCAGTPFSFVQAVTPFDFDLQPTGQIDGVFRLTSDAGSVIGGFNYNEEREDRLDIWLARKQGVTPQTTYRTLLTDISSLRAAVIRDGATGGGDYTVPDDGSGFSIRHDDGREYAVLRLTLPVNYEATI